MTSLYILSTLVSTALVETLGLILFLVALYSRLRFRTRLALGGWIDGLILGFFLVNVASALANFSNSKDLVDTIGHSRWIFALYGITFFMRRLAGRDSWQTPAPSETPDRMARVIYWSLFAGIIAAGGLAIFEMFTGLAPISGARLHPITPTSSIYRPHAFSGHTLSLVYILGMPALVFFAVILFSRMTQKAFLWSALTGLALPLVGIFGTFSRGGWLALGLAFLAGLVLRWSRKGAIGMAALAGAVFVFSFASPTFRDRLTSSFNPQHPTNVGRQQIWRANWEMYLDHPFLGVGLSRNEKMVGGYYQKLGFDQGVESHAHNNLLNILVGTGPVGLLLFTSICIAFLLLTWRAYQQSLASIGTSGSSAEALLPPLLLGSFLAQIYFHLGGLTQCNFTDVEVNRHLLLFWGLTLVFQPGKKRP